jgi:hypothetical protein
LGQPRVGSIVFAVAALAGLAAGDTAESKDSDDGGHDSAVNRRSI